MSIVHNRPDKTLAPAGRHVLGRPDCPGRSTCRPEWAAGNGLTCMLQTGRPRIICNPKSLNGPRICQIRNAITTSLVRAANAMYHFIVAVNRLTVFSSLSIDSAKVFHISETSSDNLENPLSSLTSMTANSWESLASISQSRSSSGSGSSASSTECGVSGVRMTNFDAESLVALPACFCFSSAMCIKPSQGN